MFLRRWQTAKGFIEKILNYLFLLHKSEQDQITGFIYMLSQSNEIFQLRFIECIAFVSVSYERVFQCCQDLKVCLQLLANNQLLLSEQSYYYCWSEQKTNEIEKLSTSVRRFGGTKP